MKTKLSRLSPARLLALGFAALIFTGALVLLLPPCRQAGQALSFLDALYTACSAVCVTGLTVVDTARVFSTPGQIVIMALIQLGGLGVACFGAGLMLAAGRRVSLKTRSLVREAMNTGSSHGIVQLLKVIFIMTALCEGVGAALCYPVFRQTFPPARAAFASLFHSVAAFNNAGFDLMGDFSSLAAYRHSAYFLIVTGVLITLGGVGFLLMIEVSRKRFRWKKLSMHARAVLLTSFFLTFGGAALLLLTERFSPLDALFQSVTARTAGFATVDMGTLSNAGILLMCFLMFIGASNGSTGGGIKTGTFFMLLLGVGAAASNRGEEAFHYSAPRDAFRKAALITLLSLFLVFAATVLLMALEPWLPMRDALFEMFSAMSTTGLSTGVTTKLGAPARVLTIVMMYIGRLGPMTLAAAWYFGRGERVRYPEGNLNVG